MVTGTGLFQKHIASDYLLLKKRPSTDNLSKELMISGYTLEEMPSLQACKDEGILVTSRGTLSLYFALDNLSKPAMSAIDEEDYTLSPEEIAEAAERFKMLTAERVENYRCMARGRDDFYNAQYYKHCPSCLSLFIFEICGMETECGHFLCDSCICRFRGGAEVFNGTFPYFCCESLNDGTECKTNIDLAFLDPQSGLYHLRSTGFVAFQENSCHPCEVEESDSRFPVLSNAVIDVEDVVVAKKPSKRPARCRNHLFHEPCIDNFQPSLLLAF